MQDILQRSAVLSFSTLTPEVSRPCYILDLKITFARYLTFNANIFYAVPFLKWEKRMVTASQILSSILCLTTCVIQIKEALTDITHPQFKLLRIQ